MQDKSCRRSINEIEAEWLQPSDITQLGMHRSEEKFLANAPFNRLIQHRLCMERSATRTIFC